MRPAKPRKSKKTSSRGYRFEIFQGKDEDWYFALKAPNNRIIAVGEGYTRREDVERAIATILIACARIAKATTVIPTRKPRGYMSGSSHSTRNMIYGDWLTAFTSVVIR